MFRLLGYQDLWFYHADGGRWIFFFLKKGQESKPVWRLNVKPGAATVTSHTSVFQNVLSSLIWNVNTETVEGEDGWIGLGRFRRHFLPFWARWLLRGRGKRWRPLPQRCSSMEQRGRGKKVTRLVQSAWSFRQKLILTCLIIMKSIILSQGHRYQTGWEVSSGTRLTWTGC